MGDACSICRGPVITRAKNFAVQEIVQNHAGIPDFVMCEEHKIPNFYKCVTCNNVHLCIHCIMHSVHWNHRCVPIK
ncbi:ORF102L [Scale drop disease virus]|nr:ORF102L [Scale drop disease virus]